YDPSLPSFVMVFRATEARHAAALTNKNPERVRVRLENLVRVEMSLRESKSLVASRGGMVVAIGPLPSGSNRDLKEMAEEIRRRAQANLEDCGVAAGIGRPTEGGGLVIAYREAEGALGIGIRVHGPASTTYFGDLGIMRLLARVGSTSELENFRQEMLGRLEEHDGKTGGELVRSLEALFYCHGNLSRTAEHLSLHRNSLLYRLQRISEITGHDLEDAETVLSLQVALKVRQLLDAGRASDG
ncbi:MAG: helix-turn-helix domain-containing protein, partial [Actinobacteria bacterium]|nr:helix-turn-helix domain-containing protein [Actinomycetota bacterium]